MRYGGLVPTLQYSILSRILIALATASEVTTSDTTVPSCSGFNELFTGCGSTISGLFHSLLLGTVPGAPAWVNIVLVSVVNGPIVLVWFLTWLRGVPA